MASPGVLIVGGGQAAVQIAISLRELGSSDPITIATQEPHPPYQRPPLSKAFLSGAADAESLVLRTPEYYEREDITLRQSCRVIDVRLPVDGQPGVADTDTGEQLQFDRLALATGARPRRLTVPGCELAGVGYLRDIADATSLKNNLDRAEKILVVGGGFIGLEAASVVQSRGLDVTVVEATDRLIGRVVAPVVSQFYLEAHRRRGTHVILGAGVERLEGRDGEVSGAHLSDGTFVAADLVLVGIGVEPRVEIAQKLGLECENGIVVDQFARTSNPLVVAAGDCSVTPHPAAEGRIRLESVGHAVDQAKCAAATMMDAPVAYETVPWFWSDQGSLKLQIAGLSGGYDQTVVRGDLAQEKFAVFYFRAGALIAVHAVNSPREYIAVRRALTAGAQITPEAAADPEDPLRP